MYSRRTYEGQFRIPEHYSGTAFRNYLGGNGSGDERRDAVGRPSALPNKSLTEREDHPPIPIRKKAPLPLLPKHTEEATINNEPSEKNDEAAEPPAKVEKLANDDIIISALLLSLIGGKGDKSEDITLIILVLLLIL